MFTIEKDNLHSIFENISSELRIATVEKDHPFRYVSIGTSEKSNMSMRMVVLRKVDEDLNLYFYTDARTEKIRHLKNNPRVYLLFYHESKKIQLRVNGLGEIHQNDEMAISWWNEMQEEKAKVQKELEVSEEGVDASPVYYSSNNPECKHFCVVKIMPDYMDVLQQNRLEQIKACFFKVDDKWKMDWISH